MNRTTIRRAASLPMLAVALAWVPVVHGQTWSELWRVYADEVRLPAETVRAADVILGRVWQGGRDVRLLEGGVWDLVRLESGSVTVPPELRSLAVVETSGTGSALAWSEAASMLARVLMHRQLLTETLPTEMHAVETDGGVVRVPQIFVDSTRIAMRITRGRQPSLDEILQDASVRRKVVRRGRAAGGSAGRGESARQPAQWVAGICGIGGADAAGSDERRRLNRRGSVHRSSDHFWRRCSGGPPGVRSGCRRQGPWPSGPLKSW